MAEEVAEPASRAEPGAYLMVLVAWLVPGLGHFLLGKRKLGVAYAAIIFSSFALGCALSGNLDRILANQPLSILATFGSMGVGLAHFVLRHVVHYQGEIVAASYEYGTAFLRTAGVMNLLLVFDVWDRARASRVRAEVGL